MNIVKELMTYTPVRYYLWLGAQLKNSQVSVFMPKQIWYLIIKLIIERTNLRDLLAHISDYDVDIWVRLQPTDDIFSTLYLRHGRYAIDNQGECFLCEYHDEIFKFNNRVINLETDLYDVELIHGDQIIYKEGTLISNCPVKNVEGVTIIHGVGRFFSPKDIYVGEIVFGHKTGLGRIYFVDGDVYVGQVIDGQMSGQGTYYFSSLSKYTGEFLNHEFHGYGRCYNQEGFLIYEGQYEHDVRSGHGTLYVPNKGKFVGQFKCGLRHGSGRLYNNQGTLVYDGDYKDNFEDGHGTLYLQTNKVYTGSRYVGQMSKGQRHGYGKYYDETGSLCYDGQYENGRRSGYGTLYCEGDGRYTGQVVDGDKHGYGQYYDKHGQLIYSGQYQNGVRCGRGTLYLGINGHYSRATYVGQMMAGKRHGSGIEYYLDHQRQVKYNQGSLESHVTTWYDKADRAFFGQCRVTYCRMIGEKEYVKSIWSDNITTERSVIGKVTIGHAKIHFLDGLVFHVHYDEGDILTDYMLMSWSTLDQKICDSILV